MLRGSLMKSGTAASETPDPLMRSTDDTTTPFFVFQLYTILHTCIIDICLNVPYFIGDVGNKVKHPLIAIL
jgi:hypothetical protein